MSNLFIDIRRPKAEKKIIQLFEDFYKKGEILYKSKEYHKAIDQLKLAYDYLNDIWDEYPKICNLYLIMKASFHIKNYSECLSLQDEITKKIKIEKKREITMNKIKSDMFLKIEAKMAIYELFINFIYDKSNKSIDCILNMINCLSQEKKIVLEDKIKYFWYYFKSFVQMSGITKTNKFKILNNKFDSLIISSKKDKDNYLKYAADVNKYIHESKKRINPDIIIDFKLILSIGLKDTLYKILNRDYFLINFGISEDKVITFLEKNMNIYVQDNNRIKLLHLFKVFVILRKIDLKKKFNMTMEQIISIQKSRIEDFNTIYANLIGSFQNIFKKYIKNEKIHILEKSLSDTNKLTLQSKPDLLLNNIKSQGTFNNFTLNFGRSKEEIKKFFPMTSFNYFSVNNKDIKYNYDSVSLNKQGIFSSLPNKKHIVKIKNNIFKKKRIINFKLKINHRSESTINKNNHILNKYLSKKNSESQKFNFPEIIKSVKSNNKKLKLNFSEEILLNQNSQIKNNNKINLNKIIEKFKKKNVKQNEVSKSQTKSYELRRNINKILIDILIDLFTLMHKLENNLFLDNETINYKRIFPRKIDLIKEPKLANIIKSYHYYWHPNYIFKENPNSFFYYENFFLIQNLILMGICQCYGRHQELISNELSSLVPSYLIYLMIDDYLRYDKKDINEEIYKLVKTKENSKTFKDMYLLKYLLYKFNIHLENLPLFNENTYKLKKQVKETFYYIFKEIKLRYKITADISGINILSLFVLNEKIYIFHVGFFEISVGKYDDNFKKWEHKTIIKQDCLTEDNIQYYKKIKNKKHKIKNKENLDSKNNNSISNLSYSEYDKSDIDINTEEKKEIELTKYDIQKEDKFIIIGSIGFFNIFNNDEIVNIIGNFYNKKKNAQEASLYLVELLNNNKYKKANNNFIFNTDKMYNEDNESFSGYFKDITFGIIFL